MTDIHNEAKTPWRDMPKKQRKAIKWQVKAGATFEFWGYKSWVKYEDWQNPSPYCAYRIRPGTEVDMTPAPDLTAIDKPLGLLDPATQAALRAHGEPYQMFAISGWVDRPDPVWSPACTYRVKPKPALTPLVVDWSRVPELARFAARDENGQIWASANKPQLRSRCWCESGGFRIDEFPGLVLVLDPGTCGWTDSLIERPEGEAP